MSPAVAFRVWRVEELLTGPQLTSPYREDLWSPGLALEARCKESSPRRELPVAHREEPAAPPPVQACSCGIYAYHQVGSMINDVASDLVGGAVLCWGRIVIHREGLRAQFARPLALCYPSRFLGGARARALLERLASAYRLPVVDSHHVQVFAAEFGESFQPPTEAFEGDDGPPTRHVRRLFSHWFGG